MRLLPYLLRLSAPRPFGSLRSFLAGTTSLYSPNLRSSDPFVRPTFSFSR